MSLKRNKVVMAGSAAILTVAMLALPGMGSTVKASTDYTIYVAVDQSVIGGSALIQPVAYTTNDTTKTLGDALNAVKGSTDINIKPTSYGSYLTGVESVGTSATDINSVTYDLTNYPMASSLTTGAMDAHMINTNYNDGMLSEKEFTGASGWMFGIDSQTLGKRSSDNTTVYYSMDTTIADLLDTEVLNDFNTDATLRCYYSLNMGADLGMQDSSYLPTNAATYSTDTNQWAYDWTATTYVEPTFKMTDKDALVVTMADDSTNSAYADALVVLDDVDATDEEVQFAIDNFEF